MNTLQKLTVKDAYRIDDENPILVKLTAEFSHIIYNFAHHAELRGVFIVEDDNRFAGVITRTDLLDWARAKLGALFLKPLTNTEETIRLASLIDASTAGEVLRPETKKAGVSAQDTLADSLRIMIETNLTVLPVINESQHIIGSLTLSELLDLALTDS